MQNSRAASRLKKKSRMRIRLLVLLASLAGTHPAAAAALAECWLDSGAAYASVKAGCVRIEVPENPQQAEGSQIGLHVAVVPSLNLNPEPDPLVILAGGPGQAATAFYLTFADAFERVRLDRELVLVDQRGTGKSNPLDCNEASGILDSFDDAAELVPRVEACLESMTGDPRYYTTSVAVRDLEQVRRTLGYGNMNLYGISYGTRVAQHYLRRYPKSTRSLILDGVLPADLALGPGIAIEAQSALDALMDRCAEDSNCNKQFPALRDAFRELLARLAAEPREVEIDDPASGARVTQRLSDIEFAGAIRVASYSPATAALIPLLIDAAWREQRYEPLAAQALMTEAMVNDMVSIGMHNSVVCTEDAPYFDAAGISTARLEATYLGTSVLDVLRTVCSIWPAGYIDEDFKEPLASDIPVLLLSGENDPVTPPAFAERARAGLSNSMHLVGPKQGHGLAVLGCLPRVLGDFVATASLDGLDTACVSRLTVTPFFIDFSGPRH